ncbi:hypothetical protein ACVWXN_004530 [Bradyrhizobium sp. i1.4.4]
MIQPHSSHPTHGTGPSPGGGQLPFLATKILPARFGGLVARPRLLAILSDLPAKRLGVIKAPAGFGKSSLAATWAETLEQDGQCRCVADDRSGRRRGHAVSVLRFPGPASRLPGRRRRRDRADPREQFDRPNGDPVEPDQRSGGDGGRRLPVSRGLSLGQRFSHPSDRRVFFEARTVPLSRGADDAYRTSPAARDLASPEPADRDRCRSPAVRHAGDTGVSGRHQTRSAGIPRRATLAAQDRRLAGRVCGSFHPCLRSLDPA